MKKKKNGQREPERIISLRKPLKGRPPLLYIKARSRGPH
jgi:hypothetical protein